MIVPRLLAKARVFLHAGSSQMLSDSQLDCSQCSCVRTSCSLNRMKRRQKKEDARASVALIRQDRIPSDAYV